MRSELGTATWGRLEHVTIDRLSSLGPLEIAVYVALLRHADSNRTCFPSMPRIATVAGLSERRTRAAVKALIGAGLVDRSTQTNASGATLAPLYYLPMLAPHKPAEQNDTGGRETEGAPGTKRHCPPARGATLSKYKEQDTKNKAAIAADLPSVLNTEKFRDAWSAFQQHRREKKATMTPTAISRAIAKLERMGHDRALAALEHSTANGYTGVYEPSAKNGNGKPETPREPLRYRG